jgi:uncharacterized surface anchored protein
MVVIDQQPTCGSITIIKHTLDGSGNETGIDQAFGYTTTGGLTPSTFSLNDSGASYSISSISAANPAVVTTSAANTITTGQVVTISGSNSTPKADGSWVATRISSTKFSIPLTVTTAGTAAGTVSVSNTQTYSDLPPGAYSVTEGAEPQNFAPGTTPLTCKNNGTTDNSVVSGETATIGLQPQDNWVCTYVNQQQLGAIVITKTGKYKGCSTQTAGSAIMVGTTPTQIGICGPSTALTTAKLGGATFSVTSGGTAISGSPFTTSNTTGAVCIGGLPFGTYSVTETGAPTGYKVDSSSAVSVSVSASGTCNSGNTGIGTGVSGVVTGTTSAPSFSDTPKTDITVEAKTQLSGATQSTVTCGSAVDTSGTPTNNIGDSPKGPLGDAKVTDNNESPGTYYCKIVVDP